MKNNNTEQLLVLKKLFSYLYELDVIEYGRLQEIKYHINRYEEVDVEIDIMYDIEAEPWEENILVEISDIYEIAKEHNIYFFDCPFKVYENYFESRKNKFFENNTDANELDFLLSEVHYFSNPNDNRYFINDNKKYFYSSYFVPESKYVFSLKRKLEFLEKKLLKYNQVIDLSFIKTELLNYESINVSEIQYIRKDKNNDGKLNKTIDKSSFSELIPNKKSQKYTLKILEDLSITVNGVFNLSERKKGAVRGVVEALREHNIVSNLSLELLNYAIASEIHMTLKSKLDYSTTSDLYKSKAEKYIKENPFNR